MCGLEKSGVEEWQVQKNQMFLFPFLCLQWGSCPICLKKTSRPYAVYLCKGYVTHNTVKRWPLLMQQLTGRPTRNKIGLYVDLEVKCVTRMNYIIVK